MVRWQPRGNREMSKAAEIQREREKADLERHVKRIAWLETESPKWADGTPVGAYDKRVLLTQSRDFVSSRASSPPRSHNP